jgi:hypothetical protein
MLAGRGGGLKPLQDDSQIKMLGGKLPLFFLYYFTLSEHTYNRIYIMVLVENREQLPFPILDHEL